MKINNNLKKKTVKSTLGQVCVPLWFPGSSFYAHSQFFFNSNTEKVENPF